MCVFWIYKHIYCPYMASRERAQWAKAAEARAKAAKERANRAKDPGPCTSPNPSNSLLLPEGLCD